MAKLVYLFNAARVAGLILKRKAYLKYGNLLVYLHFRYSPNNATEDTLREMLLEFLRKRIRKNEQYTYTLWIKIFNISVEKLGVTLPGEAINEQ
jgi:hypothetical protein